MAKDSIVFALANPVPEVDPVAASEHAAVVAEHERLTHVAVAVQRHGVLFRRGHPATPAHRQDPGAAQGAAARVHVDDEGGHGILQGGDRPPVPIPWTWMLPGRFTAWCPRSRALRKLYLSRRAVDSAQAAR